MKTKINLPNTIHLDSEQASGFGLDLAVDSTGRYSTLIPPGPYRMSVRHPYLSFENKLFTLTAVQAHTIRVAAGKPVEAPTLELTFAVPDLIPSKGILHDFNDQKARELDAFR